MGDGDTVITLCEEILKLESKSEKGNICFCFSGRQCITGTQIVPAIELKKSSFVREVHLTKTEEIIENIILQNYDILEPGTD